MKKAYFILIFLLIITLNLIISSCTSSEKIDADPFAEKVDNLFAEWNKPDSPGAALAVLKDGSVIYKKGHGSAQLEYGIPITPSTIFHVASVSKQFTAFAVTMLAQQGMLSLDDDIRKHLPEVPDFGKTITIKHLIHHTSGIRDQWELLAMAGWRLDDVITKKHILKMVRHQKDLNFTPGDEHLYCNTGYTLLAEIVERISGQSFRQWTQENIFRPLGMKNTHFHDDHEMIVKNRAYSYSPLDDGGFKKRVLSYANVGATSLFTTVEDLLKWAQNLWDARVGGSKVIEQMQEQEVLNNGEKINYAYGLSIGKHKGLKTVGHGGSDAGFRSRLYLFPDQKFAVAILSNLASFNPTQMALKVADIFLADKIKEDKDEAKKAERKIAKVDPAIYDSYVGRYKLPIGLVIITKENERLKGEWVGQAKFEFFPESETKFFLKIANWHITFHPDEEEYVNKVTVYMAGENMTGERITPPTITQDLLAEYVGDYYSSELRTTYSMVVEDLKLIAKHQRHEDQILIYADRDHYLGEKWFFNKAQFTRDKDDRINGFLLTGGRVRNLRFNKQ